MNQLVKAPDGQFQGEYMDQLPSNHLLYYKQYKDAIGKAAQAEYNRRTEIGEHFYGNVLKRYLKR